MSGYLEIFILNHCLHLYKKCYIKCILLHTYEGHKITSVL